MVCNFYLAAVLTAVQCQPGPISDYFRNAKGLEFDESPIVTVNGHRMPSRFKVSCHGDVGINVPEATDIEFALVTPRSVNVDGLSFKVDRPFYIAATELSNAQYASLSSLGGVYYEYDDFVVHQSVAARMDPNVVTRWLPLIEEYLRRPNAPALTLTLGEAGDSARTLMVRSGLNVRLPRLAEWFVAARGYKESEFWWGDEVDETLIAWRSNAPTIRNSFEFIRDVNDGVPNPLGLYNVFGNAGELVVPSLAEREVLRQRYGPFGKTDLAQKEDSAPGYAIDDYSAFSLGGSVDPPLGENLPFLDKDGARGVFRESTTSLRRIVLRHQFLGDLYWCASPLWATGTRFVVEVPDGDVLIEEQ